MTKGENGSKEKQQEILPSLPQKNVPPNIQKVLFDTRKGIAISLFYFPPSDLIRIEREGTNTVGNASRQGEKKNRSSSDDNKKTKVQREVEQGEKNQPHAFGMLRSYRIPTLCFLLFWGGGSCGPQQQFSSV